MVLDLIDKLDNFEIVRASVANILAVEEAGQRAAAASAGKDPELWRFDVFEERSNPWERYLASDLARDHVPIVNVWYDGSAFSLARGNAVERQTAEAIFNVDCYASATDVATLDGHVAGDRAAALALHRVLRLVRNILMSSDYVYLSLRGLVERRWIESVKVYQPQGGDGTPANNVIGARVTLAVEFPETSPQFGGEVLEVVAADVHRNSDGQLYLAASFDQT